MALNEEFAARQLMFMVVIVLVPLSLIASLNARKMLAGVHREVSDRILISELVFFAGMIMYFLRDIIGEHPSTVLLEHVLILSSFAYAFYTLLYARDRKAEWGILDA